MKETAPKGGPFYGVAGIRTLDLLRVMGLLGIIGGG
jgi:hypothetical protein